MLQIIYLTHVIHTLLILTVLLVMQEPMEQHVRHILQLIQHNVLVIVRYMDLHATHIVRDTLAHPGPLSPAMDVQLLQLIHMQLTRTDIMEVSLPIRLHPIRLQHISVIHMDLQVLLGHVHMDLLPAVYYMHILDILHAVLGDIQQAIHVTLITLLLLVTPVHQDMELPTHAQAVQQIIKLYLQHITHILDHHVIHMQLSLQDIHATHMEYILQVNQVHGASLMEHMLHHTEHLLQQCQVHIQQTIQHIAQGTT
mgnify:CR=1 FL=1